MKTIIKLTLLLAFLLPATASAYDFEIDGIYYNINNNEASVTWGWDYGSYGGSVVIPATVTYNGTTYPVTSIDESAFNDCRFLTNIDIPNSVTSIGNWAFYNCLGLTNIDIPNSVMSIGSYAFEGTTWYENQPNGLMYAGLVAYKYKGTMPNNTNIILKDGTVGIAAYAFDGCSSMTFVSIPNSVTSIGDYAFSGCSGLANVSIPNSVTTIGENAFNGTAWYENQPNGLVYIGLVAYKYKGTMPNNTNIILKDGTVGICSYAFGNCRNLTSVTIPNTVTYIGNNAFYGCSEFSSVNISDISSWCNISFEDGTANPLYYANHLYLNGTEITNLTVPSSVTSIGNNAFYGYTALTSVTIPNSVTSIGSSAFYGCSGLTSVSVPNSVTSIGRFAFNGCSGLASVTIPNSVTSIGRLAFRGCSGLSSVNISDIYSWCNISFGDETANPLFYAGHLYLNGTEITNLSLPSSVTSISNYAFYNCTGLTSVTIPNSVTSIGYSAFCNCTGLTSVTIPNSVTSIDNSAFSNCTKLKDVYCYIGNPSDVTLGSSAFGLNDTWRYALRTLYVPTGSSATYQSSDWYNYFGSFVEIGTGGIVTSIELDKTTATVIEGQSLQLTATVMPEDATNKVLNWATSNAAVATVDGNGLVTAIAPGSATITATTTDRSNLSALCTITVKGISADNYLSMGDTTVMHGETIVIPVKMTNEASIISFQTDIFLPEGLELMQEDGEYIIDPSERMTRTHSIMSNEVSNGAIRVLCYSSNYKPFTGNSGDDLFYITVKVADNAEGDYTIQLKNTLLTNTDFVDLVAPDVAANVNVKAYLLGDANNSGTVTVGDVVVTAQYVLELSPQPFVFEAADVNMDNNITVADVSRIAWMVLNPAMNAPMRAPVLWNNGDLMGAEGISLKPSETRRVSITLDNEMDYSAFQLDLMLPSGLTASNFQLTGRASGHAFDVNTLQNGNIRALCYSPLLTAFSGHEGALLTFDVTATGNVSGDITVDGIELVTTACQSVKLDAFTIGVNDASAVNELANGKAVARVNYFNLAGQQIERPESGVTLVVTTYTDGTRTVSKVFR